MSFTKRLFYCVIMEVEKEREYMNQIKIAKKLLTQEINLWISREWGSTIDLTPLLTNIIYETAIKENKKVLLITSVNDIPEDTSWFHANLVSRISNIDLEKTLAYLAPFSYQQRLEERQVVNDLPSKEAFFSSLETIKNSHFQINESVYADYGNLYFIFDEHYKNTKYDLVILKDINSCLRYEQKKLEQELQIPYEEARVKVLETIHNYARKTNTQFLFLEGGLSGYGDLNFYKHHNVKVIDYNAKEGMYHFDTGEKVSLNSKTNEILTFEENGIEKTFETRFTNNKISVLYSEENQEALTLLNILKEQVLKENTQIRICDFDGKLKNNSLNCTYENFEDTELFKKIDLETEILNLENHYDYLIINDFITFQKRCSKEGEEIVEQLYQYAKYENTKIIILNAYQIRHPKEDLPFYHNFSKFTQNIITTLKRDDEKVDLIFEESNQNPERIFAFERSNS